MKAAAAIDAELRALGTPERAVHEKAYLKSDRVHHGASVPAIRQVAKRHAEGLDHDRIVALAEALWALDVHDDRMAAVEVLVAGRRLLGPDDLPLVERLLRDSGTWALVDGLAANVVGDVVARAPEAAAVLDRWVGDDDFWIRRSALLALLVPLRHGGGDVDRLERYVDLLLDDREWFVQKAIGWVLRDTGRKRPDLVESLVRPRWDHMPTVARREIAKSVPAYRGR